MASLEDVFLEQEMTNWLKAWLALNITKTGLHNFVDTEVQQFQLSILQSVTKTSGLSPNTTCTICCTANLLKCPTDKLCNKRNHSGVCKFHDTTSKLWRQCPTQICDKVRNEIVNAHRFKGPRCNGPSWNNTSAEQWASNHWEVGKCYMPPDGYIKVRSFEKTDFNGVISIMLNCTIFDSKLSFSIAPQLSSPCLLTKAREVGKAVRHSPDCKVTSADLQEYVLTLVTLLSDSKVLIHDVRAQDAVTKLNQLQSNSLKLSVTDVSQLLKDAHQTLTQAKQVSEESKTKMEAYIDKLELKLNVHVQNLLDKCTEDITKHTNTCTERSKRELDIHVQKVHSRKEELDYEKAIDEFQRRLKKYYLDNLRHVPVSPLVPSHDKSLMEIYVTPKIHRIVTGKDGVERKAGQIFKYNDIFQEDPKAKKHVFLQGEPGKGKTTFAAKLLSDWCNDCATTSKSYVKNHHFADVETLQAYTFVFHIALRESRCQRNLTEIIKKQIIEKIYAEKDVNAAYILLQRIFEEEICLVVQDGLDEWCDPDKELVLPFLAQTFRCIVLITTRPWKMSDERLKNSQIDCLLELEGVMDSSMLSKNILGCLLSDDLDSKHEHFETYVRGNSLIKDLVLTPMMLTHIVCLWVDGTILTGSTCEIYSLILDSFLKRNSNKWSYFQCPPFKCFENTKYLQPNYDHIQSISRAAFYLLFSLDRDGSLVFSDKVLYRHLLEEQKVFALNSGILSERKTSTLSCKPSTMFFIHKSIQEFLAALYIALNVNVIDDVFSAYLSQTPNSLFDISQVFIFVCGLNIGAANRISSTMNSHCITNLNQYYKKRNLHKNYVRTCIRNLYVKRFQDVFITGFLEAKSNNFKDQEVNLQLHHFNFDIDENRNCALKSLLSNNVCNVQSLGFSTYKYPDLHGYEVLSSSAHCLQYLQIGDFLTYLHETIRDTYTKLDLSLLQRLQKLYVYERYVELLPFRGFSDMKSLTLYCKCDGLDLSSFKNLRELELGEQVTLVPNALYELNNLESLSLTCKYDGLDLTSCKKLKRIKLDEHVKLLPNALQQLRNLDHLDLKCMCDGLDLSSCTNLKDILLGKHITLLPFALRDLHQVQKLNLECK
ncbi:hypothetical protein DPMN_177274 [Dreissena polymorpha]|uniref:NACHT domain-containing protein n=1 Tax=Dreissena polymorpha TaxID=45954 RepID=A0A9D4IIV5_DREPO|nr:hypothetical protein DPMN_177274 [Dreissena polymorpha]